MTTGSARRPRRPVAGRAGVVLHLRAPRPRPAARPAVPVLHGPRRGSSSCAGSPTTWPPTRRPPASRPPGRPMPGFVHLAHAWAAGDGLADVLEDEELSGGDFVRNVKQLIDLLAGSATSRRSRPPRARARQAADALHRGVVTASSAVEVDETGGESERAPCRSRRVSPGASPVRCLPTAWSCAPTPRPAPIVTAARRAGEPIPPLGLLGGDLCRTLGGTGDEARLRSDAAVQLPVDLGAVLVDGRLHWFVAHLVARHGWWRGRVVAAMNAQFLGRVGRRAPWPPQRRPPRRARRRPALRRAAPGPSAAQARHPRAAPAASTSATVRRGAARPRPPTPVYLDGERLGDPARSPVDPGRTRRPLCVVWSRDRDLGVPPVGEHVARTPLDAGLDPRRVARFVPVRRRSTTRRSAPTTWRCARSPAP